MEDLYQKKSILQMARGAIQERADYEITKILDNILDPNTSATAARKLTLTLTLKPDDTRQNIAVGVVDLYGQYWMALDGPPERKENA